MTSKSLPDSLNRDSSVVNSYLVPECQSTVQSVDQGITPISLLVQSALHLANCRTDEAMDSAKLILQNASTELIEAMPVRVFRSIFTEVYEAHLSDPTHEEENPAADAPSKEDSHITPSTEIDMLIAGIVEKNDQKEAILIFEKIRAAIIFLKKSKNKQAYLPVLLGELGKLETLGNNLFYQLALKDILISYMTFKFTLDEIEGIQKLASQLPVEMQYSVLREIISNIIYLSNELTFDRFYKALELLEQMNPYRSSADIAPLLRMNMIESNAQDFAVFLSELLDSIFMRLDEIYEEENASDDEATEDLDRREALKDSLEMQTAILTRKLLFPLLHHYEKEPIASPFESLDNYFPAEHFIKLDRSPDQATDNPVKPGDYLGNSSPEFADSYHQRMKTLNLMSPNHLSTYRRAARFLIERPDFSNEDSFGVYLLVKQMNTTIESISNISLHEKEQIDGDDNLTQQEAHQKFTKFLVEIIEKMHNDENACFDPQTGFSLAIDFLPFLVEINTLPLINHYIDYANAVSKSHNDHAMRALQRVNFFLMKQYDLKKIQEGIHYLFESLDFLYQDDFIQKVIALSGQLKRRDLRLPIVYLTALRLHSSDDFLEGKITKETRDRVHQEITTLEEYLKKGHSESHPHLFRDALNLYFSKS